MIQIAPSPHTSPEMFAADALTHDDKWMPVGTIGHSRPLMYDTHAGSWVSILRARGAGTIQRHRHAAPVTAWTLDGGWGYREHDWVARAGSFVYEPPGEIHTLVVPEDCPEMITFFSIAGAMIYLDDAGRQTGYEDVFSKIDMCRRHYIEVGLGERYVDQFIR